MSIFGNTRIKVKNYRLKRRLKSAWISKKKWSRITDFDFWLPVNRSKISSGKFFKKWWPKAVANRKSATRNGFWAKARKRFTTWEKRSWLKGVAFWRKRKVVRKKSIFAMNPWNVWRKHNKRINDIDHPRKRKVSSNLRFARKDGSKDIFKWNRIWLKNMKSNRKERVWAFAMTFSVSNAKRRKKTWSKKWF